MPWLTPEEVLVQQAAAGYAEAAFQCGAMTAFTTLESQEAFINGWWIAKGMGPAPHAVFESFQESVDRVSAGRESSSE